jgi:folate-dependent phosphoribosylglycinamide formyltransferase PurN
MRILYLTTRTVHHAYVLERLEDAGHEVVTVSEDGIDFSSMGVFKARVQRFTRGPSIRSFVKYVPFVRVPLFDRLQRTSEARMLEVKRPTTARLHLRNINELVGEPLLEENWDLVLVFGTRQLGRELVETLWERAIPIVNVHCAVLPYIRGLESHWWSLVRRQWHEIGVTIHFIEQRLDTGDIVGQSTTDLSDVAHPWQLRGTATREVAPIIIANEERLLNHESERFLENRWETDGRYYSFPGILVQLGGALSFYLRKLGL